MTQLVSFFVLLTSILSAAPAERPKIPLTGTGNALGIDQRLKIDKDGKGPADPRAYYELRSRDAACMADLAKAKTEYSKQLKAIRTLKDSRPAAGSGAPEPVEINNKIDLLGKQLAAQRSTLLNAMNRCGECSVEAVIPHVIKTAAKTEVWYESDGSCQIPSKDKDVLKKAFQRISDSLTHAKRYPHHAEGGFGSILDFQIAQVNTTPEGATSVKFDDKLDAFTGLPTYLAIWVRGPKLLPGATPAFQYFIRSENKAYGTTDLNEFELKFETVSDPKIKNKVIFPTIQDRSTSGRPLPAKQQTLPNVIGAWYLNSDGYLRYYTAAEFPFKFPGLEEIARYTLLDTLAELSDRGDWE